MLDLTLIDLPGLAKVPVGDSPPCIEGQLKQLAAQYISTENCLVLVMLPANSFVPHSDALKIAKKCDPQGKS